MQNIKGNSGIPLYFQIKQILQNKITSGEYKIEERIPTETDLCNNYAVSRITVRKAIDILIKEKLLYTKQGVGTFVAYNKLIRELSKIYSFSEDMRNLGLQPSSKVVSFVVEKATIQELDILNLPESNQLVNRIVRVRLADSEPILLETTVIPQYLCRNLKNYDIEKDSLYRILSEDYGLTPYEAEETYEAAIITAREAELLKCKRTRPVFHIHRIGYLSDSRVFELTRATGRGDHLRFKLHLATNEANFSKQIGLKSQETKLT